MMTYLEAPSPGKGMRMGRHTRSAHSMDDSNADRPSRKISADAVMRKASFANAKMAKHRQQSESRGSNGGSEDMDSSRSRENLQREGSSFGDEPGCSDGGDDTGGSRRARSTTSTRISLFFPKQKMEMLNTLKTLKETTASRVPEILVLEENWQQIVKKHEELSTLARNQQMAIWEIVQTEWNYLEHLRHMDDLKRFLNQLKDKGFLQEINTYKVFCNYSELYECHIFFWKTAVLPMLENSRMNGVPLDPILLWPGFENIAGWADYYIKLHFEDNRGYITQQLKENHLFKEFIEWVEQQQDVMKRLKFVETITSRPMQHLTRYGLLLNAVLKNSTDPEERVSIQQMIDRANEAGHRLNFELDSKDLRTKLTAIMMSIDGYDYIDFDDTERIWGGRVPHFDLVRPMFPMMYPAQFRKVLLKGEVKVKEGKNTPKMDVVCFIFTDLFLICRLTKKGSDRLRIARPPMHITKINAIPHETPTTFYLTYGNEFGLSNIFLFTTSSADDTRKWLEMIQVAQKEFMHLNEFTLDRRGSTRQNPDGSSNGSCIMGPSSSTGMLPPMMPMMPMMGNVHRKSSSMDSQAVAAQQAYNHHTMAELRKAGVVSSTEQLDRGGHSEARLPPRAGQKLSVASCVAAPISTSKSSIDLHLAVRPGMDSPVKPSRSRSNSSGPEIGETCNGVEEKRRSRSPSPTRRHTVEISGRGTPQGRSSPLVTGGRNTPLESVRNSDSARGTPRSGSPALTGSPDCESVSHSPALLVTAEEEERGEGPSNGHRRFEKRYHTSDGIDVPKSKGSIPGGILKRFSWNVSSAVNTSRGKISRLNEQTRRSSQSSTAASSESFASSTSGVSSASSALEPTIDELSSYHHISTISVGGDPVLPSTSSSQSTLSISLDHDATVISHNETGPTSTKQSPPLSTTSTSSSGSSPPPPLPDSLPPPQNNNTVDCSAQAALTSQKELLRFIMDNQLETSDV